MNQISLFLLAIIPIAVLMLLIIKFKVAGNIATFSTLIVTAILALTIWHKPVQYVTVGALQGALKGFWPICMVIIGAIFCYNIMLATKSMDVIKNMLAKVSSDKRVQVLLIAWGFGGFLEGVAGFGTAVAIPTGILIILGFNPMKAILLALLANTVTVAFGAVGIPVITLADLTELNVQTLSFYIVAQLTIFNFIIPYLLIVVTEGSFKAINGVFWLTTVCTTICTAVQLFIAMKVGAELVSIIGTVAFIISVIVYCKLFKKDEADKTPTEGNLLVAASSYIIMVLLIIAFCPLFPAINKAVAFGSAIPFNYGAGADGVEVIKELKVTWLNTPGVLIIIATLIGGLMQGSNFSAMFKIFGKTLYQLRKTIMTVMSIVALAQVMDSSGMILDLSNGLIILTGGFYPFIAPIVGAVGTFVTGSDTSSNILFGKLQLNVANKIGVNPEWLVSSNTTGAALGKMISPQSIAVATSATNQEGQESAVMGTSLKYCLALLVVAGLLVGILSMTMFAS